MFEVEVRGQVFWGKGLFTDSRPVPGGHREAHILPQGAGIWGGRPRVVQDRQEVPVGRPLAAYGRAPRQARAQVLLRKPGDCNWGIDAVGWGAHAINNQN